MQSEKAKKKTVKKTDVTLRKREKPKKISEKNRCHF